MREIDGRRVLLIDGVVQSIAVAAGDRPSGFWSAMLPASAPRAVLILGLGGGTVARLLQQCFGPLNITGVDDDAGVLEVARRYFHLDDSGIRVVHCDAAAFLRDNQQRFDLVLVDLFRGEALPSVAQTRAFLRHLRASLTPGGVLIWNLHRDQRGRTLRRRLAPTLRLERSVILGLNLILHLRRRSYRRHERDSREA